MKKREILIKLLKFSIKDATLNRYHQQKFKDLNLKKCIKYLQMKIHNIDHHQTQVK